MRSGCCLPSLTFRGLHQDRSFHLLGKGVRVCSQLSPTASLFPSANACSFWIRGPVIDALLISAGYQCRLYLPLSTPVHIPLDGSNMHLEHWAGQSCGGQIHTEM